jgi:hypothetical protein
MDTDLVFDPAMTQAAIALGVVVVLLVVGGFILFASIGLTWFLVRKRKRRASERAGQPTDMRSDAAIVYGVRQQVDTDRFMLTDYQLQLIANRANELRRADQEVELDKLLTSLTRPTP